MEKHIFYVISGIYANLAPIWQDEKNAARYKNAGGSEIDHKTIYRCTTKLHKALDDSKYKANIIAILMVIDILTGAIKTLKTGIRPFIRPNIYEEQVKMKVELLNRLAHMPNSMSEIRARNTIELLNKSVLEFLEKLGAQLGW